MVPPISRSACGRVRSAVSVAWYMVARICGFWCENVEWDTTLETEAKQYASTEGKLFCPFPTALLGNQASKNKEAAVTDALSQDYFYASSSHCVFRENVYVAIRYGGSSAV